MKNRNRQNTRQTFGRSIFCTALAMAALGMTGCEDPQLLDQETYYQDKGITLPNGEKYELDIAMITPFAGHINPERKDLYLYIYKKDKVYKSKDDISVTDCSNGVCAEIDTSNIRLEGNNLKLKISDNHELTCIVSNTEDPDIQNAHCPYYLGGAVGLYQTWEALKRKDTNGNDITQIRVSSGDSFGTSADISARLNDIPTPIVLNAIGLHVDTFGNHNFDQDLEYLRNILSMTNYKYLATNLTNVPQMLEGVSPRILIDLNPSGVSSEDIKKENLHPMRVAIVSALDMEAMATVQPGKLGSLGIGNYCNFIQSIEDAYNDGARAFFILSHMFVNKDSLKALFNAIGYFKNKEAFYNNLFSINDIHNYQTNNKYEGTPCSSVLEVPQELLSKKFQSINPNIKHVSDINFNNQIEVDAYHEIINDMHKEIYNAIIGVLGEGSTDALAVKFYPSDTSSFPQCTYPTQENIHLVSYPQNGCSETNNFKFYDQLRNSNLFENIDTQYYLNTNEETKGILYAPEPYHSSCYQNDSSGNLMMFADNLDIQCRKLEEPQIHDDKHAILFIQFPAQSVATTQLSVSFNKNENYKPKIEKLNYQTIVETIDTNNTNNFEKISYSDCDTLMFNVIESNNNLDSLANLCSEYFDWRKSESETFLTSINYLKTENEDQLQACFELIKNYANLTQNSNDENTNNENQQIVLTQIQNTVNALNCVHLATARFVCSNSENTDTNFKDISIFDFGQSQLWHKFHMDNVNVVNDTNDRTISIFKTNLAVDSIFNYLKSTSENENYDFVMTNAGDLKRITDLREITYSKLVELVPYTSTIRIVPLDGLQLANLINDVLTRCDGSFGGYPIFSGLVISTASTEQTNQNNDNNNESANTTIQTIQEIWTVDTNGALLEPIYIKLNENNTAKCQSSENSNCVFAQYTIFSNGSLKSESNGNFIFKCPHYSKSCSLTLSGKLVSDGNGVAWIQTQNDESHANTNKIYKMLSSSYLIDGGDYYNFDALKQNISDFSGEHKDYSTKEYIINYLNKESSINSTSLKKEDVCYHNNSTSNINCNENNTDEPLCSIDKTLCRFLLNKHFYISNTSDNFSRYVSSQADDSNTNEPFDDTCNKLLYPTNDEN